MRGVRVAEIEKFNRSQLAQQVTWCCARGLLIRWIVCRIESQPRICRAFSIVSSIQVTYLSTIWGCQRIRTEECSNFMASLRLFSSITLLNRALLHSCQTPESTQVSTGFYSCPERRLAGSNLGPNGNERPSCPSLRPWSQHITHALCQDAHGISV